MQTQNLTSPAQQGALPSRRAEPRYARVKKVAEYCNVHTSTIWRWTAENPNWPRPKKWSARTTVWDLNEIDAFLEAQQGQEG